MTRDVSCRKVALCFLIIEAKKKNCEDVMNVQLLYYFIDEF